MSFVSPEFILFFVFLVPIYYRLPERFRMGCLLFASYVFYAAANSKYVLLLFAVTVCDYFFARAIGSLPDGNGRRFCLWLALSFNLSILFFFKYFNFFNGSIGDLLRTIGLEYRPTAISIVLPLGVSFFTFQGMGYVIDVYRGSIDPERRFGTFALFVAFFPQLVAGPIERARQMLPQFHRSVEFSYDDGVAGLRQILWGCFKKIVVADRLAIYVNEVYGNPHSYTGPALIIATVFFAFQIYCDFSGYSDIAIGAARILGFRLMQNFRQPYFALSMRDFWQRWHISLSSWFRDYVYFPLAARMTTLRGLGTYFSFVIVFTLSGLWHGANWTFVVWGALHGFYLVCEYALNRWTAWAQPPNEWIPLAWSGKYAAQVFRAALTFALACIAWVFFRAASLSDAVYILKYSAVFPKDAWGVTKPFGFVVNEFWLALAGIVLVIAMDAIDLRFGLNELIARSPAVLRWALYYSVTASILIFGYWGIQEFIYFKF